MSFKVHFNGGHIETARSLLANSFIDFQISTSLRCIPVKPTLFLKSSLLQIQKWCLVCLHILSSQPYSRSNNPKDCCLVILEVTDLFCNVAVWFLSEHLERDYWYRTLHHLEWKSNLLLDRSYEWQETILFKMFTVIFALALSLFLLTNSGFVTPNHVKAADTITLTDCVLNWWERSLSGTSFFWPLNTIILTVYWNLQRKITFILKNCTFNHSWICFKFFK